MRELFCETKHTRPADFHICRRMFCSMLARAGVDIQTAQILAGHSAQRVHQRYVDRNVRALPEVVELPAVEPRWAVSETQDQQPTGKRIEARSLASLVGWT